MGSLVLDGNRTEYADLSIVERGQLRHHVVGSRVEAGERARDLVGRELDHTPQVVQEPNVARFARSDPRRLTHGQRREQPGVGGGEGKRDGAATRVAYKVDRHRHGLADKRLKRLDRVFQGRCLGLEAPGGEAQVIRRPYNSLDGPKERAEQRSRPTGGDQEHLGRPQARHVESN